MNPIAELTQSETDRRATLKRRGIFEYHDGFKKRFGDRLAITLRLQKAAPSADIDQIDIRLRAIGNAVDPDGASTDPPVRSLEALADLQPVIAAGFSLQPFCEETGEGLTSQECLELLGRFIGEAEVSEAESESESETKVAEPEPGPESNEAG